MLSIFLFFLSYFPWIFHQTHLLGFFCLFRSSKIKKKDIKSMNGNILIQYGPTCETYKWKEVNPHLGKITPTTSVNPHLKWWKSPTPTFLGPLEKVPPPIKLCCLFVTLSDSVFLNNIYCLYNGQYFLKWLFNDVIKKWSLSSCFEPHILARF